MPQKFRGKLKLPVLLGLIISIFTLGTIAVNSSRRTLQKGVIVRDRATITQKQVDALLR